VPERQAGKRSNAINRVCAENKEGVSGGGVICADPQNERLQAGALMER
jgi:hypothetical protein